MNIHFAYFLLGVSFATWVWYITTDEEFILYLPWPSKRRIAVKLKREYYNNGTIMSERWLDERRRLQGKYTLYTDCGRLLITKEYINGILHGKSVFYGEFDVVTRSYYRGVRYFVSKQIRNYHNIPNFG